MSWQTECTFMLRQYINDVDPTNYTYDDVRLTQVLVVAAKHVSREVDLTRNTYTIDVGTVTISPDPADDPEDTGFLLLMTLKAACLLDWASLRDKARQEGVKVKIGPSEINVAGGLKGFEDIINQGPCKMYELAKRDYMLGVDIFPWRAVLTPFTNYRTNYPGQPQQGDAFF